MKRVKVFAGIAVVFAFVLFSCSKSWTWNQKIEVTVETPVGLKVGSSVQKARFTKQSDWFGPPEARGATTTVSGEAVVVEITPGRYLFVLLKNLPRAHRVFYPEVNAVQAVSRIEAASRPKTEMLLPSQYPLLVTFTDINDPLTVKEVNPSDLAEWFGPGVSLKSITMTITNERRTKGAIYKLLPWLVEYNSKLLDGNPPGVSPIEHKFAHSLNSLAFKLGK